MRPEEIALVTKCLASIVERLEIVAGTFNYEGFPRGTQVAIKSTLNYVAEALNTNKEFSQKFRQALIDLYNELAELDSSGILDKTIVKDKLLAILKKFRDSLTSREFYGYIRAETAKLQEIIRTL